LLTFISPLATVTLPLFIVTAGVPVIETEPETVAVTLPLLIVTEGVPEIETEGVPEILTVLFVPSWEIATVPLEIETEGVPEIETEGVPDIVTVVVPDITTVLSPVSCDIETLAGRPSIALSFLRPETGVTIIKGW
jgi:hypothetical protein